MIDLEKLYAYKSEYELEVAGICGQMNELEKQLIFANAKLEVVDKMISDEISSQEPTLTEETATNETVANINL